MAWTRAKSKWPWRDFLTADEQPIVARYDALIKERDAVTKKLAKITPQKTLIANRALRRAKYAANAR